MLHTDLAHSEGLIHGSLNACGMWSINGGYCCWCSQETGGAGRVLEGEGRVGRMGRQRSLGRGGQRKVMQSAWNHMFQSWMYAETTLNHLWHPAC